MIVALHLDKHILSTERHYDDAAAARPKLEDWAVVASDCPKFEVIARPTLNLVSISYLIHVTHFLYRTSHIVATTVALLLRSTYGWMRGTQVNRGLIQRRDFARYRRRGSCTDVGTIRVPAAVEIV